MAEVAAVLESLDERGEGMRVEFTKQGDRFGHVIAAVSRESAERVFGSVENPDGEATPANPTFQELHRQGQTLFLTGATRVGHWSMSVSEILLTEHELSRRLFDKRYGLNEPPKHPAEVRYVAFEVACRLKSKHDNLGSSYEVLHGGLATCDCEDVMTVETLPPLIFGNVAIGQQRECRVRVTEGDLVEPRNFQICPPARVDENFPCTVEWRYGIFWF